jgi:hypothetical protein
MLFSYISKLRNLINYTLFYDKQIYLGRWCHKGVPKCDEKVIEKKIKFALLDNNFCITNKNKEKVKKK